MLARTAIEKRKRGSDMDRMIEAHGLRKSYGDVHAVKGIDVYVERGKLFAFLGPNGAGKSTTLEMLSTLLKPDEGEVYIDGRRLGQEDAAIRSAVGIVFQDSVLDKLLTVRENLIIRSRLYENDRANRQAAIDATAKATDIDGFLDRPYGKLSGGQRRRADIARALVHTPKLLFLDEPTTGLDPQTRRSVWDTIATIQRERGATVFFSTHYMEEAAKADYILIIDHGEIVAKGTPADLKARYTSDLIKIRPQEAGALKALLADRQCAYTEKDGQLLIPSLEMDATLSLLNAARPFMRDFEVVHGTMDDVFIAVTGAEVREV